MPGLPLARLVTDSLHEKPAPALEHRGQVAALLENPGMSLRTSVYCVEGTVHGLAEFLSGRDRIVSRETKLAEHPPPSPPPSHASDASTHGRVPRFLFPGTKEEREIIRNKQKQSERTSDLTFRNTRGRKTVIRMVDADTSNLTVRWGTECTGGARANKDGKEESREKKSGVQRCETVS